MNYKCRKDKEFHCGARLVYKDGVYRISGTHHTHPIEDDKIGRISFVNECCRRAGLQIAPGELKSIFEETLGSTLTSIVYLVDVLMSKSDLI